MIPWRAGPADFIDDANSGCTPVQHQQRVAPCQPGIASSKFIRYRIASSLSRRMRARRLRSCLPAPSKRPCSKKPVRPKRRCVLIVGPTHPACNPRNESAALRVGARWLSVAANVLLLHKIKEAAGWAASWIAVSGTISAGSMHRRDGSRRSSNGTRSHPRRSAPSSCLASLDLPMAR
jgi:hypothetical protein